MLFITSNSYGFVFCPIANLSFVHVPKTGGSYISSLLVQNQCTRYMGRDERIYDHMHVTPWEIDQYSMYFTPRRLPDKLLDPPVMSLPITYARMFAVTRHPYHRVVSSYHQRANERLLNANFGNIPPFPQFMSTLEQTVHWCCTPSLIHFRPSHLFTHLHGVQIISRIFKYEKIHEVEEYLKGMGIHVKLNLKVGNHCKSHTDKTLAQTYRVYKHDFKLFDYDLNECKTGKNYTRV